MYKECEYCNLPWERIAVMKNDLLHTGHIWAIHVCDLCFVDIKSENLVCEVTGQDIAVAQVMEISVNFPQTEAEKIHEEIWYSQAYSIKGMLES